MTSTPPPGGTLRSAVLSAAMLSAAMLSAAKLSAAMLSAAVLCAVPAALSCRDHEEHRDMKNVPSHNDLETLVQETGLALPPGARLVGMEREPRGEAYLRAKVLMTSSEWAAFAEQLPLSIDAMDPGTGGFLGQDEGFWDPNGAAKLRTGQVQRKAGTYLNVGFDDSDPSAVKVYIVQHGT